MSLKNCFLPQHLAVSNLKAHGTSRHISLLTRGVWGTVKLSGRAAFFRPIHEVGWLIHVLSKENHGAFSKGRFWGLSDKPGKAAFEGQTVLPGHTSWVQAKLLAGVTQGTRRDLRSRGHRKARGHGTAAGSPATTGVCLGWRSLRRLSSQARPVGTPQNHGFGTGGLRGAARKSRVHRAVSVPKDLGVKRAIEQKINPG